MNVIINKSTGWTGEGVEGEGKGKGEGGRGIWSMGGRNLYVMG